jgi:hypothetical protein
MTPFKSFLLYDHDLILNSIVSPIPSDEISNECHNIYKHYYIYFSSSLPP